MSIENLRDDEYRAFAYYSEAQNRYDPGTLEYIRCQHILAWLANKIRARERSDKELQTLHTRLLEL